jgi:flagellar basal-body rod protein FlgF
MDTILYKASLGANASLDKQALSANNLANANTSGFRADLYQATSVYMLGPNGESEPYPLTLQNGVDGEDGALMVTNNPLDVAVQGQGWLVVESSEGKEAYTRDGALQIDANGMLTTAKGFPVVGNGGPILLPPAKEVHIGSDGTVSIIPMGSRSNELAALDRLKLVKLDSKQVIKSQNGLFLSNSSAPIEPDGSIQVKSGMIENSNVNVVEEMVNMIENSRQFEYQTRLMNQDDKNAERLAQLLQE